jgi:signal recognition particle subunit SEC65
MPIATETFKNPKIKKAIQAISIQNLQFSELISNVTKNLEAHMHGQESYYPTIIAETCKKYLAERRELDEQILANLLKRLQRVDNFSEEISNNIKNETEAIQENFKKIENKFLSDDLESGKKEAEKLYKYHMLAVYDFDLDMRESGNRRVGILSKSNFEFFMLRWIFDFDG